MKKLRKPAIRGFRRESRSWCWSGSDRYSLCTLRSGFWSWCGRVTWSRSISWTRSWTRSMSWTKNR